MRFGVVGILGEALNTRKTRIERDVAPYPNKWDRKTISVDSRLDQDNAHWVILHRLKTVSELRSPKSLADLPFCDKLPLSRLKGMGDEKSTCDVDIYG